MSEPINTEKKRKIEQFALNSLEGNHSVSKEMCTADNDKWNPINSRKWEYRHKDVILATIFHKPNGKFSLYVTSPDFYKAVHMFAGDTFQFASFDDAANALKSLLIERGKKWAEAIISFLEQC